MCLLKINLKNYRHLAQVLFISQSYCFNDRAQLHSIFQMLYYTLKRLSDTKNVLSWKSKGMSAEKVTILTTTDNDLSPLINRYGDSNFCLSFKGGCLKQENATFTPPNRIIFFIVCKLDACPEI